MPQPPVAREVAEIAAEPDRATAYAWLLHLQRGCADDLSAAADLAAELPSPLLPLLLRDAADPDEAVADSALKCLGFALYHPVLVSTISAQMAQAILDSLVQLIMNTRMKSVCNLGTWCISVQKLEPLIIEDRADPVVTAIVHALDNPFGSLSTTFEAAQAIMKLACQIHTKMRDLSSLWVPPIYRRLLSADKPERDMTERCLIKVSCVILPPQPCLSKAVALDLEQKLLSHMMNMLDDPSKKIQAVRSWGWIISLLGQDAVNNRPRLNKLLKVPEQMFIDLDTQVQIATMLDILGTILNPELLQDMIPDKMLIVMNSSTEIFRFLLGGVQIELKDKRSDEQVRLCITDVCKFVKTKLFLDCVGKHSGNSLSALRNAENGSCALVTQDLEVALAIDVYRSLYTGSCNSKAASKIIGDQLTDWLSLSTTLYCEMQQGKIIYQLEKLWLNVLDCLNNNQLIHDLPFSQNQQLLQVARNHPHQAISVATKSACRAEENIKTSLRSGFLGSELDGLSLDKRKDHNSSSGADKAIAREEIGISSRPALPMSKKRTKHAVNDSGSLKISAGLGRKQLKIMKYSTKPRELNKNTASIGGLSARIDTVLSPRCIESKECRKPELILEMLKRKR
nr:unnamed protein product [Digitaria exilis]